MKSAHPRLVESTLLNGSWACLMPPTAFVDGGASVRPTRERHSKDWGRQLGRVMVLRQMSPWCGRWWLLEQAKEYPAPGKQQEKAVELPAEGVVATA